MIEHIIIAALVCAVICTTVYGHACRADAKAAERRAEAYRLQRVNYAMRLVRKEVEIQSLQRKIRAPEQRIYGTLYRN